MAPDHAGSPVLVLGPLLRYVSETEATVWAETDRPCQVEVLGHTARTFAVAGHHYALVVITGLRPGTEYAYEVLLDGTVRWPEPEPAFGPSVLRTIDPAGTQRLEFGSCRRAELPAAPDHDPDAMAALAHTLAGTPRESWPAAMLLIGDQVYADATGPATRRFIEDRRDPSAPPGYEVADFEEYCALYREAWTAPAVRWLLSVLPTIMIFDDHDVHDDWNISAAWRRQVRAAPWWQSRITGAYMSYWIYQHLGNLSPAELGSDTLWRHVQELDDGAPPLRDLAQRADEHPYGIRWSVRRNFGRVRVVVIDSRGHRVVDDDGHRLMVDEAEWEWVTTSSEGDADHLVLVTSLPLLLPHGIHDLEAWNEKVCAGAWGNHFRARAERLRQEMDLEHWPAFPASFAAFEQLLRNLTSHPAATALASVTIVSGDIHHSYLAPVDLPGAAPSGTAVYQAVCSPIHNVLPRSMRLSLELVTSRLGGAMTAAAARLAGVRAPGLRWRITDGPWFTNMLAELSYDGPRARIRFDRPAGDPAGTLHLEPVCAAELTRAPAG